MLTWYDPSERLNGLCQLWVTHLQDTLNTINWRVQINVKCPCLSSPSQKQTGTFTIACRNLLISKHCWNFTSQPLVLGILLKPPTHPLIYEELLKTFLWMQEQGAKKQEQGVWLKIQWVRFVCLALRRLEVAVCDFKLSSHSMLCRDLSKKPSWLLK